MESKRINSRKRQAILDYLRAVDEHPTAEMVYNRLKPDYPELSLGTVYRNLSVLEEDGLVISVGNVNGQERYDARVEPHAHFVCGSCHRVSDVFLNDETDRLLGEVNGRSACKATSYTLTFYGLCADCCQKG